MELVNLNTIKKHYTSGSENELLIKCLVVDFIHEVSKKGNPFAVLDLKDEYDVGRYFFFGVDYQTFKNRNDLVGKNVLITGKCKQKRFSDEFEFKIFSIKEIIF